MNFPMKKKNNVTLAINDRSKYILVIDLRHYHAAAKLNENILIFETSDRLWESNTNYHTFVY